MITDAISSEFMQTMGSLCKECGISGDHFINFTSEVINNTACNATGIYYTNYIVYSSPEGNVTASTLVTLLQKWLLEAEENEMQVTVGDAHLVIYKLCGLGNNNLTSKELCRRSWLESVLCLVNDTSLGTFSSSPTEPSLENFHMQTFVLVAVALVVGLMAGTMCTVLAAVSWSVRIVTKN